MRALADWNMEALMLLGWECLYYEEVAHTACPCMTSLALQGFCVPRSLPTCFLTLCVAHEAVPVQFHFWDMEAAIKLIKDRYSWFLPTFEGYNSVVAKGKPASHT